MRLFAIDNDNTITAFPAAEQIPEGQEHFATEKELAKLAANWPADRLVQVWNSFAGVAGFGGDLKPVKKFTDRKSAVARIWKAIQKLDAAAAPETAAATETATTAPKAAKGAPKKTKANQGGQDQGPARPRRAKAARRPSCWNCCAARTARRWPRSPRPPTGRTTAFGASSAAASPRKWGSRSRASSARMANGATCWHSSTSPSTPTFPPPATTVGGFFVHRRRFRLIFLPDEAMNRHARR